MRITLNHVLTMASAALVYGIAMGQEAGGDSSSSSVPQTELRSGDLRASNLLGAMVKRLSGDTIGEVEDLIVSAEADVRLAVISVGGILGLGAKTIAIPFDELTVAPDGSIVYLTMSDEELQARPAFDVDDGDAGVHSPANEPADAEQPAAIERSALGAAPGGGHGAGEDSGGLAPTREKATKQPASALLGAEVIGSQSVSIGRINDLVVTAEPPEVQVILELGGSRLVAVPLGELSIPRGHGDPQRRIESVETSLTASQLDVLPSFEY